MRQYGSASVDRLLKYCGFEVPSETTYTLQTFATDIGQHRTGGNDPILNLNSSVGSAAQNHSESDFLRDSTSRQFGIAERGNSSLEPARADVIRAKVCGDILRTARSQRNEVQEIVRDAQFMATAAGMWPPLSWIGLPVVQTTTDTIPNQPTPPQSSPSTNVVLGPSDLVGNGPTSSRFSWDQFVDILGPMLPKPGHVETTGFAWWQGIGSGRPTPTFSGDGCKVQVHGDSPTGEHSIYVVSNVEGHSYEGEFKEGKMHGYGRLKWPDGHWYQGQFDKERTCGIGIRGWPSGHWYVGEEQGGWKEGLGAMGWPGGRRYEGEFRKDLRNGFGLMTWPEGRWYLGYWKDGLQQGEGLEGVAGVIYLIQSKEGTKQSRIRIENHSGLEQGIFELISQDCVHGISAVASEGRSAGLENEGPGSVSGVPLEEVSKPVAGRGRRRGSSGHANQSLASELSIKEATALKDFNSEVCTARCSQPLLLADHEKVNHFVLILMCIFSSNSFS